MSFDENKVDAINDVVSRTRQVQVAAASDLPEDDHPVFSLDGNLSGGLLFICDHARNHIPRRYNNLGLERAQLSRHIAYDIGMEALTRKLAEKFNAPAILSNFSRLLIDPNRGEDDPTLIMRLSDGAVVPGNRDVDATEREARLAVFHRPYHSKIASTIDKMLLTGVAPIVISLHSFTPIWRGFKRPWEAGILWDKDSRAVEPFIDALKETGELTIGDNEPYTGRLANDTMNIHCTKRGLPHLLIEVRQDLVSDNTGIQEWVVRLAGATKHILQISNIHDLPQKLP